MVIKPFSVFRKALFASIVLVLTTLPTGMVFADSQQVCTPPSPTQNGVRWPTGADAGTFIYQCDGPSAGKWTNAYYLYDPATNSRSALYNPNYSYDCTAKQWFMTRWDYSPAKGIYLKDTVSTSAPGSQATNCPVVPNTTSQDPTGNAPAGASATSSPSSPSTNSSLKAPQTTSGSGDSSTNLAGSNAIGVDNSTNASMANGIVSFAGTGNATVAANTTGGSATTGDAQVIANVINMLQSSSNFLNNPNLLTFTANINGDVNGDLLLDPTKLSAIQPANSATSLDNNVAVNNSVDAAINNKLNLGATTGSATVTANTKAGSATTGSATAVANIVNILNSVVTAGQSFLGVININGNLNGDILLPPNFVDTLLASNIPHYTVNTASIANNLTVNNANNQAINNNVAASADSGNATVSGNTSAGSAKTGNATTNLTVFNLTGSNVVASNDLLVFVNVLGTWYGLIMNAPAGTTAASLGGGVSSNTTVASNATLNNTNNQSINNDIQVAAKSGDASVTDNTAAGNAVTGNATASVNLMNMINDSLSLNGWFGLLFINVFGTWNGSFGINTAAGNPVLHISNPSTTSTIAAPAPVFRFVPFHHSGGSSTMSSGSTMTSTLPQAVLAAATHIPHPTVLSATGTPLIDTVHRNLTVYFIGAGLAFAILLFGERNRLFYRR